MMNYFICEISSHTSAKKLNENMIEKYHILIPSSDNIYPTPDMLVVSSIIFELFKKIDLTGRCCLV